MSPNNPTLHMVCGKIAAGKSTLATELGAAPDTVVVREDEWLARLYPSEQANLADYVRNSTRLRNAMAAHLIDLLRHGLSVILDFPANTPASRSWMRTVFETAGCAHQLHHLDVPDELCKARLRQRNVSGGHEFLVSEEDVDVFTRHFVPPGEDEAFNVIRHHP